MKTRPNFQFKLFHGPDQERLITPSHDFYNQMAPVPETMNFKTYGRTWENCIMKAFLTMACPYFSINVAGVDKLATNQWKDAAELARLEPNFHLHEVNITAIKYLYALGRNKKLAYGPGDDIIHKRCRSYTDFAGWGKLFLSNKAKYGCVARDEWCTKHWGTAEVIDDATELEDCIQWTGNEIPQNALLALSAKHPNTVMRLECLDLRENVTNSIVMQGGTLICTEAAV